MKAGEIGTISRRRPVKKGRENNHFQAFNKNKLKKNNNKFKRLFYGLISSPDTSQHGTSLLAAFPKPTLTAWLPSIQAMALAVLRCAAPSNSPGSDISTATKLGMFRQVVISVKRENIAHSKVTKFTAGGHFYFQRFCQVHYSETARWFEAERVGQGCCNNRFQNSCGKVLHS